MQFLQHVFPITRGNEKLRLVHCVALDSISKV
jgi:hypothetical protein